MTRETFPARIRFKRRTTAEWLSDDPILYDGEPGIEVLVDGSEREKRGDGVTKWSLRPYVYGSGGCGGTSCGFDPIRQGYAFSFTLDFTGPNGDPLGFSLLTASRILGQFRLEVGATGAPLATVDTSNGTIVVASATSLSFSIPAATTATFPAGGSVWVDFARLVNNEWLYIPPPIEWPVADTVTAPPAP